MSPPVLRIAPPPPGQTGEAARLVAALVAAQAAAAPAPPDFALDWTDQGLTLTALGEDAPGPLCLDFVHGALAHRRQYGGGSGQMIAKAAGLQAGIRPRIVDATAGLGRDAFVLASLGCEVTLIERQPTIAALLADALARARLAPEVAPIAERMQLLTGDAIAHLKTWRAALPQVISLDPMFPHREKSALVKKEMRLFRPFAGDDEDAPALLAAALALATHRVIVKRPRKAPPLAGPPPGFALSGSACRFDIYPKQALKRGVAAAWQAPCSARQASPDRQAD